MGKHGPAQSSTRPKQQHIHGKRGVAKPNNKPLSALAASVHARRAATSSSFSSAAMAMLEQRTVSVVQDPTLVEAQLVDLINECLASGKVPLTTLGTDLRDRSTRLSLADGFKGQPLHKALKETWGGLEAFLRAQSNTFSILADGTVKANVAATVETGSIGKRGAPVASSDINALTLDAL